MRVVNPEIVTSSGQVFNYVSSTPRIYHIEDIAQGLSNICRFTGQCNQFYSVAEHSLLVSNLLPPKLKLAGLLHDASEAYLGDVNSPLKSLLPEYKVLEQKIQREIAEQFGLPYPYPKEIHEADWEIFCQEWQELMPNSLYNSLYILPPGKSTYLSCYCPALAKELFLQEYKRLIMQRIAESVK